MFEIRAWGRAFNTLRVEPWDGKQETERAKGKMSKKKAMKARRKAGQGKKEAESVKQTEEKEEEQKAGGRAKGQVYLVANAWMREAWPYN